MSAKYRHVKAAQKKVCSPISGLLLLCFLVVIDLEVKTYSRLNLFKDRLNDMNKEILAKANKEEIVRMSELLWVIKKLHHTTVK
ncbi:hypothetical protein KTH05_17280 [Acinetobacter lactucae]|uniref:hypothetical protein n=1 Tax=Acinetobacter lactucae TaxID=1785128 RepID=UPI0021CDCD3E|nr:hypothetical protein [Acinetobacter lactucae]MCU4349488.1 hypothetical protein [Acinetobacter lactucae]